MIDSIHHVQISIPMGTEDIARDFYCGSLGMREIPKPASLIGRGGFWAELDGFQIHFGTEDGVDRAASKAHVAYLVADLEESRRDLNEKGIEVINGIKIPGFERFEFRDPFGNRVEFLMRVETDS
jgi:catechol 2,3-dioxygenase-like lactoylglutathione lyase family enzyme